MGDIHTFFAAAKAPHFIRLNRFGLDVFNIGFKEPAKLAASTGEHVQNGLLMQAGQTGDCPNADTLTKHVNDFYRILEFNPEIVQWLLFGKCGPAFEAFKALHIEVFVTIETTAFSLTIAACTVQLDLSRPRLKVTVNPQDSATLGLWPFVAPCQCYQHRQGFCLST